MNLLGKGRINKAKIERLPQVILGIGRKKFSQQEVQYMIVRISHSCQ